MDLYIVYRKNIVIGQCHADDADDAIATMMTRKEFPLMENFDNWGAEVKGDDEKIDKCLNCGKYKATASLSYPGQTCLSGCRNPAEY